MIQRDLARLQLFTVIVTLALVAFTLWISDGVPLGRWISGVVLFLGFVQWLALRRFAHQMAANDAETLEEDTPSR
ncbi:MAG: hypothetical protein WBG08_04575 [Litorimonas sp.]